MYWSNCQFDDKVINVAPDVWKYYEELMSHFRSSFIVARMRPHTATRLLPFDRRLFCRSAPTSPEGGANNKAEGCGLE